MSKNRGPRRPPPLPGQPADPFRQQLDAAAAQAQQLYSAGAFAQAEAICRQVLQQNPGIPLALNVLGLIASRAGAYADAEYLLRQAIAHQPHDPTFPTNLGLILAAAGQIEKAVAAYRQALALQPDHVVALNNLGNTLCANGRPQEGVECFARATAREPGNAILWYNQGSAQQKLQNPLAAIACFEKALALRPNHVESLINLGICQRAAGQAQKAVTFYRQALALAPDCAEAYNNLGTALAFLDQVDEAEAAFRRALELKPDNAPARWNLGTFFSSIGNHEQAHRIMQETAERQPDDPSRYLGLLHQKQYTCDWNGYEQLARKAIEASKNLGVAYHPFAFLTLETTPAEQLHNAQAWVRTELAPFTRLTDRFPRRRLDRDCDRLTIGYISRDFRQHVVATLIAEVIELHDRDRFRIVAYSYGKEPEDALQQRLQLALDKCVDIQNLSHPEAAQAIHDDQVDILVDLKGYTTGSRPEIAAYHPAPVQVRWLGHAGTMGSDWFDYILVDRFIVPPELQPYYSEKLCHLPDCYQPNDRQRRVAPRLPTRAECGLPDTGVVFCCFNTTYKLTPEVFAAWMEILQSVPHSVLWLMEAEPVVKANLVREAAAQGVDPQRLVFAPHQPHAEHLARYRLADLFLDTRPVNACATASDALWVGCPLLTCAGQTFSSRAAGSILHAAGLPELVTTTPAAYREKAIEFGRNPEALRTLRAKLEATRLQMPLFDSARFTRNLEAAFTAMWEESRRVTCPPRTLPA